MSLVDCLLMTLFNAAICITLPKAIFLFQQAGTNRTLRRDRIKAQASQPNFTPKASSVS